VIFEIFLTFIIVSTLIIGFKSKFIFFFILLLILAKEFHFLIDKSSHYIPEILIILLGIFIIINAYKNNLIKFECLQFDLFSTLGLYLSFVIFSFHELIYKFYFFEQFKYVAATVTLYFVFKKSEYYYYPILIMILANLNLQNNKLGYVTTTLAVIFFYVIKFIQNANTQKTS
jgi:hypothetical protein